MKATSYLDQREYSRRLITSGMRFSATSGARSAFDGGAPFGEGGASLAYDVVDVVDRRDMFVDDRLVDERPQGISFECNR